MEKLQTEHNKPIAIAKGIGILLMVIGHSGCPEPLSHWLYMFHMPLFFFLSGFLLKDKYVNEPILFLKRKVKGLYFPFIKWVIIFAVLHNLFAYTHVNEYYYTFDDFIHHVSETFLFHYDEALVGGFWFLRELFYANVIAFAIIISLSKLHLPPPVGKFFIRKKAQCVYLLIVLPLVILSAWILSYSQFENFTISLLGASYILAGYLFSKLGNHLPLWLSVGLIGFSIIISGVVDIDMSMLAATGKKIFMDFPVATMCIISLISISSAVSGWIGRIFDYIGSRTLDILTFHFLSMKLVSLIAIFTLGLDIDYLSSHPVIPDLLGIWWILYTIVGTIVPIAMVNLVKTQIYPRLPVVRRPVRS